MSAAPVIEQADQAGDDVALRLQDTLDWLAAHVTGRDEADPVGDAVRIDRIALTERLQAALEAVKAVETVTFATSQTAEQMDQGVHPDRIGRGIADQIALAAKVSPAEGSRRLNMFRDLVLDMPHTLGLLTRGEIGGWTARVITEQVSHLDRATRSLVDTQLADLNLPDQGAKEAAATTNGWPTPRTRWRP